MSFLINGSSVANSSIAASGFSQRFSLMRVMARTDLGPPRVLPGELRETMTPFE